MSGSTVEMHFGTVLVVEHESSLRRLFSACLEKRKYTVFVAKDGAEALEIFRQHADLIQLVVIDLMMPHMDGFELKQHLAAQSQNVKFLFMSGYTEEIVKQNGGALDGCGFLEKPFLPQELADKVSELLVGGAAA